jgi:phage terminase large subunit GpA-like protein
MLTGETDTGVGVQELFYGLLQPPKPISIAEHAKEHYHLSADANPIAGNYDVEKTPYLKKIMECLEFSSPFEEVVLMKGCQLGGTSVSIAFLLWLANTGNGCTALVVFPTERNSQKFVKHKFRPAIQGCKSLWDKVKANRESLETFQYPGGSIHFGNAHAPNTMRMLSCRVVLFDEVSDFPVDAGQGDALEIGRGRTTAFPKSYPSEYFDELLAMQKITDARKGKLVGRWVQDKTKRCEGNDCRRMAMAAMMHLVHQGLDLNTHCRTLEKLEARK